jgi:hypothetical protein
LQPAVLASDTLWLNFLNVDTKFTLVSTFKTDDGKPKAASLRLVQLDILNLATLRGLHDRLASISLEHIGNRRWRW